MKFKLNNREVPNGVILVLGIRYANQRQDVSDNRGRTEPLIYTYAALKAGGLWYITGAGRVPVAAGWGAVEKWLERDGRILEFVEIATGTRRIWPEPVAMAVQDDLPSIDTLKSSR